MILAPSCSLASFSFIAILVIGIPSRVVLPFTLITACVCAPCRCVSEYYEAIMWVWELGRHISFFFIASGVFRRVRRCNLDSFWRELCFFYRKCVRKGFLKKMCVYLKRSEWWRCIGLWVVFVLLHGSIQRHVIWVRLFFSKYVFQCNIHFIQGKVTFCLLVIYADIT